MKLFLNTFLYSGKKNIGKLDALPRLFESFCADFVHAVSKGQVIMPKHFLLSLGMHNMTGQVLLIQIVNKLGHCISYPKTCDAKTALAELSIKQSKELKILSILPVAEEIIPTSFWVDNFDIKVERLCSSGVVNTIHLMAFQEPSTGVTQANVHTPVTTLVRTGKRKLSLNQDEKLRTTHKIDPNAEPPKFHSVMSSFGTEFGYPTNQFYILWSFLRRQNHVD